MHGNMMELTVPKSARGPHTNRDYKLVVVGHRAVGKSALVVRFLTKRFISEYQENSEMTCNGVVEIDGERLQLNIQDTSEKGIRVPTVDHHFRWADAIMLVYSITDSLSYQRLRYAAMRLKEKVTESETADARIPAMVVVGNKGDLDHMRKVTQHDGLRLAEDLGCSFFETSASEGWSSLISTGLPSSAQSSPKPSRKMTAAEPIRPTTLALFDKPGRRKSDPSIVINSIFSPRSEKNSPTGDFNNNQSKVPRAFPPLLAAPTATVPQISISPSQEHPPANKNQGASRGRRLMEKLSPRLSRKFGQGAPKQSTKGLSHIGESLARLGTAGLAVGNLNSSGKSLTLPAQNSVRSRSVQRVQTLKESSSRNGNLLDSGSSSSSTESLVLAKPNEKSATFFLRPETPTTDQDALSLGSSSEDEMGGNSDTTLKNEKVTRGSKKADNSIRRSRSVCRNLNLEGLQQNRNYNSDSDSSKQRLMVTPQALNQKLTNSTGQIFPANAVQRGRNPNEALRVRKFNASEPFKYICREARTARRLRDRKTPSQLLRDGIRKIKTSFATDHANHHHEGHLKSNGYHVAAVRH